MDSAKYYFAIRVFMLLTVMEHVFASCGSSCECRVSSSDVIVTCTGANVTNVPTGLPYNTTKLYLSGTNIRTVQADAFSIYPDLVELFFREASSDPCRLEYLEPGVFDDLPYLESLGMIGCGNLAYLEAGVLGTFQNLETLHIYRSGLKSVPDMSLFMTLNPDMNGILREIDFQNNKIEKIAKHDFLGVRTDMLRLEQNVLSKVEANAFANASIVNLYLNKNPELRDLDEHSFEGVDIIIKLDISDTGVTSLPTKGLSNLKHLVMKNTPSLKQLPSVLEFNKIERAELTYPHHCCAFKNPEKQNPSAWRLIKAQEAINKECSRSTTPMPTPSVSGIPMSTESHFMSMSVFRQRSIQTPIMFFHDGFEYLDGAYHRRTKHSIGDLFGLGNISDQSSFESLNTNNDNTHQLIEFLKNKKLGDDKNSGEFKRSTVAVNENITQRVECGEIYVYNRNITCTPEPDAFNPCEDVMGYVWLRVTVWFVLLAALLGNSAVLLVLITGRGKFTVPKFLMCNLAFADFTMGVYLIMLASIDIHTLGEYFNYAIKWQNEGGCQVAGFLSVFSSELSIFTLTILTLERWYAISHAIHLNKRLKLRHSLVLMFLGYTLAIMFAVLPLVGISGYGNVSICLPMKIENGLDSAYVISLLIINGVLFLAICFSYVSMYMKVKGSASTARSNDATIAKRMALLVFTNFACWAPIAFFGLTASAGMPLIDITNSKILLVFFYPLNSCANPFLYAILTKQFRKDVFILLGKYGICVERANMYRVTYTSRSMSHSRGGHKEFTVHRLPRQSESVFSHILESALSSKHSTNGTPKTHDTRRETIETKPFIERSHLDRAAEFANKEPVLSNDDVALDTWDTNDTPEPQTDDRPSYIRSVSDYNQFNAQKMNGSKFNPKTRSSVDTCLSSGTDTTFVSDNQHSADDIWQIREDRNEINTLTDKTNPSIDESEDTIAESDPNCKDRCLHESSNGINEDDMFPDVKLLQEESKHTNGSTLNTSNKLGITENEFNSRYSNIHSLSSIEEKPDIYCVDMETKKESNAANNTDTLEDLIT